MRSQCFLSFLQDCSGAEPGRGSQCSWPQHPLGTRHRPACPLCGPSCPFYTLQPRSRALAVSWATSHSPRVAASCGAPSGACSLLQKGAPPLPSSDGSPHDPEQTRPGLRSNFILFPFQVAPSFLGLGSALKSAPRPPPCSHDPAHVGAFQSPAAAEPKTNLHRHPSTVAMTATRPSLI